MRLDRGMEKKSDPQIIVRVARHVHSAIKRRAKLNARTITAEASKIVTEAVSPKKA